MAKKQNKVEVIETPEAPEEDLTLEEVEREQEEIVKLKDTLEVEPDKLSDEQKEFLKKNKDKLPEEQKEYYKSVIGEEETEDPEDKTPETESKSEPSVDYKKKFSESSREAQKLSAKNRVLNKALLSTDDIPEPTEEELQKEFGDDWELMSDIDKRLAKETIISRSWRLKITEAQDQAKKIEKWEEDIDKFTEDPKTLNEYPELEGRVDEFRYFAKEDTNNNVPFKLLVGAFLHEQSKSKVTHKGRMFETGSGGPNDKPTPKSNKLSLEDSRKLRESDYGKWKEYLAAGKIDLSI